MKENLLSDVLPKIGFGTFEIPNNLVSANLVHAFDVGYRLVLFSFASLLQLQVLIFFNRLIQRNRIRMRKESVMPS